MLSGVRAPKAVLSVLCIPLAKNFLPSSAAVAPQSTHIRIPRVPGTGPGKDLCWEDRRQKKREAKNEMVRQHHQLNGHKSEQTLGDSRGQRSLVCWSPRGQRVGHNSET